MTFELSLSLVDEILTAMENQNEDFAVDAEQNVLVQRDDFDDERFYKIPDWSSADGFSMRESFVKNLHSPVAKEELQQTLHSGRGVFRNFRDVLKNFPEVEKCWHIHKYRTMYAVVAAWYNQLCEIWGLEKLDSIPSSDEYLVRNDFSFKDYSLEDKENILFNISAVQWISEEMPDFPNNVFFKVWKTNFEKEEKIGQFGQVCYSLSDEFAGCLTASLCLENQEEVVFVNSLFVPENFRGLGIGTELISLSVSKFKQENRKWLFMPDFIIPDFLTPLLERMGFKKIISGYILNLN